MKIGIYINESKDLTKIYSKQLINLLNEEKIEHVNVKETNDYKSIDVVIALGGDGTILGLTELLSTYNVPIVGINAGKLGFLTEFETFELKNAVNLIKNNQLKKDERILLSIEINGEEYTALNDAVVQRIFEDNSNSLVVNLAVSIDGNIVDKIGGDGLIVSTPTGSTAYSLSSGGPILAPGIEALAITPISAHSFHNRPIIYSSNSKVELTLTNNSPCGLFIDGKFVKKIVENDKISIKKSNKSIIFLRKEDSNFYKRLVSKLNYKEI